MAKTVLGIIGGSGVYEIPGLENPRWQTVKSPWGAPSDQLLTGHYAGVDLVFLPRHGRGHVQTPSSINYRANIDALKRIGVTDVISVSACGSLKEELPPGTFLMADQFIDRTFWREKSFFGPGFVAHVPMSHPVCPRLKSALTLAAREQKISHDEGGSYICIEGPQFSTLAESELYRSWGCAVIGMTGMPEAKLAREAELPYAIVAMVTDYDCWHEEHDAVTVDAVLKVMKGNADNARRLIMAVAPKLGPERQACPLGVETVLDNAVMTAPDKRDPVLTAKLDAVAGRILQGTYLEGSIAMSGAKRFERQRLDGAVFHDCALPGSRFEDVNLAEAAFSNVSFRGAKFSDVNLAGAAIEDANIEGLTILGYDVMALIRAERARNNSN